MTKVWPPPGFRIVEGFYQLTDHWTVVLPMPLARRVEDDQLVLWCPGFTVWIGVFGESEPPETRSERYENLAERDRDDITIVRDNDDDPVGLFAYRLRDSNDDGEVESLNAFAVSEDEHLQLGIYFDDLADEEKALALIDSIRRVSS